MQYDARPRVAISACLLGEDVRYNGGHCRCDWLRDVFARYVDIVPICPEVEAGLGTPRQAMRLVADGERNRLEEIKTSADRSDAVRAAAERLAPPDLPLDGFVLKKGSPSCGVERVKVYTLQGMPLRRGIGVAATAFLETHPGVSAIEEGRLADREQRDHFATRVFAAARLRRLPAAPAAIQEFHRRHKMLLYAHDPQRYVQLGNLAANSVHRAIDAMLTEYRFLFQKALAAPPTVGKNVNVLQHIAGFLKRSLSTPEKKRVADTVESYRRGSLPLAAPVTLLAYLIESQGVGYLRGQFFFEPFPPALST